MEGKIKLIEIIADSSLGGGPRHVLDLIKNIDKEKFDVYVICPGGYLSAEAKQLKSVTVYNVDMRSKFDLIALWEIKRIINKIRAEKDPFGPLIVHTHGARGGLLGRLASPSAAKKVHTEHSFNSAFHLENPINEWVQKKIIQRQNHHSDLIIAVSGSVHDFLVKGKMAPSKQIVVIPNGIDLKKTDNSRQITVRDHKAPVIGTVGNLNFQKGQIYLIQALPLVLKKFPLATLEIVGEGAERSVLEAEIKRLNIERHVTLFGHRNSLEKYYKDWSVFVLPSISETFGIVVLEAMKNGLPVVATRVGGIPDIITQNKSGLLVEPRNEKALAQAILKILESPALAAKLKREGLSRVKDFDWKEIIKKIERELLALFERD